MLPLVLLFVSPRVLTKAELNTKGEQTGRKDATARIIPLSKLQRGFGVLQLTFAKVFVGRPKASPGLWLLRFPTSLVLLVLKTVSSSSLGIRCYAFDG